MPPDEGLALYDAGLTAAPFGPLLEIGTYCGKSAVYLGAAAREGGTTVFTIDHHQGSEEMQAGWDHHDTELDDPATGKMNSFPFFRETMDASGLDDVVTSIVGDSAEIAKDWTTSLGLVFIDGAHSEEPAMADYEGWAPKLVSSGVLVIHDVFEDPSEGGPGPFKVYTRARADGFTDEHAQGSLRVLRKP